MKKIKIIKPDDFHVHLRDRNLLALVAPHSAKSFCRVLVMPNLNPPILTVEEALLYQEEIFSVFGNKAKRIDLPGDGCYPLMTLYLTKHTTIKTVREVANTCGIIGFKLYPAHATTHSSYGISDIKKVYKLLAAMEKYGVYLMIHGEDPTVDVFDREKVFIEKVLAPIVKEFPNLKITLEHITTKDAVDFILAASNMVKASVTPHHLLLTRNELLANGLNPHYYCMPIVKRAEHRDYLLKAVLTGNKNFFLGTDSAPHLEKHKLSECGCAGIYTAPIAIELCTEIFFEHGALSNLEKFTSRNGAEHYGLPINSKYITIKQKVKKVPNYYKINTSKQINKNTSAKEKLIPFRRGQTINWSVS